MVTLTPTKVAKSAREPISAANIVSALRPWRRRLMLQQTFFWCISGTLSGLLLACVVFVTARLLPWASAPYWAGGLGSASLVIALVAALWLRPSLTSTARNVDKRLALHDRMSTAWEMREQATVLHQLQRRNALTHLQQYTPRASISLRLSRSTLLTFLLVTLVLVLLVALPNPMNTVLKQQAAFQSQITKQIKTIDTLRQQLAQQNGTTPIQKQQVDQVLKDLQTKLQQAKNDTEALQAIAQAQSKLDQLRNPQAANRVQAQTAAASSLQNSTNPNLQQLSNALSKGDSKTAAQALQNLSSQLSNLSADQRSQLSHQLEQAANQANQDPSLSSALHQLAKSVADGNQSEVNDAANAVTAAMNQTANSQAQNGSVNKASQSLQQAANALATSTDNSGQGQSQGGQGQGQGGQGQSQGGQGQGQGSQGQGGQGQGQGGQGQGQGGQGQGGQGQGGQGSSNGTGNQQGKNEQVFVPGQAGAGSSTQSIDNNNSVVQQGSSLPYSQVIQQYSQAAHDAIDNSNVSPDTKDLVHDYFNTLEGQ